jgi:hypothetical protein
MIKRIIANPEVESLRIMKMKFIFINWVGVYGRQKTFVKQKVKMNFNFTYDELFSETQL